MPPRARLHHEVRPALRRKHFYAVLLAAWVYLSLVMIGMLLAVTGALVLQELGLIRQWGKDLGAGLALLLFAGGLVVLAAWTLLMWRFRRMAVFTVKMCWYVPKSLLLWLGGGVSTVGAALTLVISLGLWAGLVFGFDALGPWPPPWWLRLVELAAVAAFGVAAAMAASLVSRASMKLLGVEDWRAAMARSLEKVEMLRAPSSDPPASTGPAPPGPPA